MRLGLRNWVAVLAFAIGGAGLGGCTPIQSCEDDEGGCSTGTDDTSGGYTYDAETPEPIWTADDFLSNLDSFLLAGTPSPYGILDSFLNALTFGDTACPGDHRGFENPDGPEGCTSDEGVHYAGVAWFDVTTSVGEDEIPLVWKHGGDFEIVFADGGIMGGGGEILYAGEEKGETDYEWSYSFMGSWIDQSRSDWLGQGFSGVYEAIGGGSEGAHYVEIVGGMAIGEIRMDLRNVRFDQSTATPWSPTGTISLRDDLGYWYALELSGGGACNDLTFVSTGEVLGSVCRDLTVYGAELFTEMSPH